MHVRPLLCCGFLFLIRGEIQELLLMLVAVCVVFLRDFYVKSVLGIARKKILERGVNFSCF